MKHILHSISNWLQVCLTILTVLLLGAAAIAASAQTRPDFSGLWKQDNERSHPARKGDVTLRITHHDPALTVETTLAGASGTARHAVQKYTIDGKVSISTGADGDQFHTSIVWKDATLVFSIEEHEDGRILRSTETWSLLEDGATLQRVREPAGGPSQTLIYRRQP